MNRSRSISASTPNFPLRRAIGAAVAVVLALVATYGGFLAVCAFFLVTGLAA